MNAIEFNLTKWYLGCTNLDYLNICQQVLYSNDEDKCYWPSSFSFYLVLYCNDWQLLA